MASKHPLPPTWHAVLGGEFKQPYMIELQAFLAQQGQAGNCVCPPREQWFQAFDCTAFDRVKVVIIGQDPYHGAGQAHGLSFSVPTGVAMPPSLVNIFKELQRDLLLPMPGQGCLRPWAEQGVLLLNATLTVAQGKAGSHQGRGWEQFTDRVIAELNERQEGLIFLLWGGFAQKKARFVDRHRHRVLTAPHPSPLSAYRGFIGCGHFSQVNRYLQAMHKTPIDWALPD